MTGPHGRIAEHAVQAQYIADQARLVVLHWAGRWLANWYSLEEVTNDHLKVAFRVAQQATRQAPEPEEEKATTPKATAGRKGGLKGGKARAARLTPAERSDAARRAALARWAVAARAIRKD